MARYEPWPKTRETTSHVPCFWSYAIAGSLTRGVRPWRKPRFQVRPLFRETAKPMLCEPPSKYRPTWKTATTVVPKAAESGSTSVACSLAGLRYGSTEVRRVTVSQSLPTRSKPSTVARS